MPHYNRRGIVSLCPVVAGPALTEHKVVGPEELPEGTAPDTVHGAGLQVHQDGAGYVLASGCLIIIDVDPLQLEVSLALVAASGVDAVLVRDDLPELGTDLVTALASLDVDDFTHFLERDGWPSTV